MSKPRIVIVGGGFAGLAAARSIGPRYDVTLVDAKPDFEFIPNLHELVSRVKKPGMLTIGHGLLERLGHQFVCDQVVSVDPGWKAVVTRSGQRLEADALILAPGSGAAHTQTPGVTQHALQLRSVEAGGLIADRVEDCAAAARPGHPVYITVIGGGYTGVEVLGEVLRIHRDNDWLRLRIIEPSDRLMKGHARVVSRRIEKLALRHGVEVRLGEFVHSVAADHVVLGSGAAVPSHLTLWAAGSTAPAFLTEAGLVPSGERWAKVRDTLDHVAFPGVFLAGDVADPPLKQPKQASNALTMGRLAGKNAVRYLRGKTLRQLDDDDVETRTLITFGDLSAFLLDEDDVIETPLLQAARELIFEANMADLEDLPGRRALPRLVQRSSASINRILTRTALDRLRWPRVWIDGDRVSLPVGQLSPLEVAGRVAAEPFRIFASMFGR